MFESATIKLTAWYLAIIVAISLLFSVVIYSIASNEVGTRLTFLQRGHGAGFVIDQQLENLRNAQIHAAESSLVTSLVITNVCIWLAGGIGSYYLARRTLQPIEETHEAQSRFTSDASHELRTPLASMRTELEVALRDPKLSKPEMRELLESNLEEVNKLTQLSQTLLQLSQLDHKNIEREKVDINKEIEVILHRLDKPGKRVAFAKDSTIQDIYANRSSVAELVTILVDNALKYSPEDSVVNMRTYHTHQMSGFEITNQGEGIAPEALPHIFDRFYRADMSRTNGEKKGYGLGLSLAKKIVQIHEGELTVSSGVNKPTTFRVLLQNFSSSAVKNQK